MSKAILEAEEPTREVKPLAYRDLVIAESHRVEHFITLPEGMQLEDLSLPEVWGAVAHKLHVHDTVEVSDAKSTFWAELLVREVGKSHAEVTILRKVDLKPLYETSDDLPLGHSVRFIGSKQRWSIFRGNQIIKTGFNSKGEAIQWARESHE